MIIAIFPHSQKKESKHLAIGIQEYLTARGATVVAEDDVAEEIGATPISKVPEEQIEFLLSMGGDGTILGLVHKYIHLDAAIVGINLGHLGFMADIPVSEIYPSLQDLILGHYTIDERITLEGILADGEKNFAVNDIVIHRGKNPCLVEMAIHVEGTYLNTFVADGLILATPNGSTAYSLAAGGPIVTPDQNALILTPISPHTISNRPIVLSSDQEIQIQYLSNYDPLEVSADGITRHELHTGDVLKVKQSEKSFRLVNLTRHDYFSTLRTKLGWAGKLR
ncbi:MAG: NAD kinase [Chlamydiae bacterium]|nr:NAD kinase [Chlamydiota bacterium]